MPIDLDLDDLPLVPLPPYPAELYDRVDLKCLEWCRKGWRTGHFESLPWTAKSEPRTNKKRQKEGNEQDA